ncbi:MAG: hypothetical protein RLY16_1771 [Bacteroidota bacterium]|jgi:hypothetical protein
MMQRPKQICLFILISITFVFAACSGNSSKEIIPIPVMKDVMWEVIQADVFTEQFMKPFAKHDFKKENAKLQLQIFNRYHVTRQQYYNSYDYYAANAEMMHVLLDSITAKGERERNAYMRFHYNRNTKPVAVPESK